MRKIDRINSLDLIRFLAAFGVLLAHYSFSFTFQGAINSPFLVSISEFARYGYLGVHIFFVISGFVILQSALNSDASKFFVGRFVRLLPLFAICSGITICIRIWRGDEGLTLLTYLANLSFFPYRVAGQPYIDGVYWTLAYEIQFYFYVLLLLIIGNIRRHILPLTWLWFACCFLWALFPLLPLGGGRGIVNRISMADYAPLFIVGISMLLCLEKAKASRVLLLAGATMLAAWNETQHLTGNSAFDPRISAGAILLMPAIAIILIKKYPYLGGRCSLLLGAASYPLYLLHQEIGLTIAKTFHLGVGILGVGLGLLLFSVSLGLLDERIRPALRRVMVEIIRFLTHHLSRIRPHTLKNEQS